jgi:hypothetical protein
MTHFTFVNNCQNKYDYTWNLTLIDKCKMCHFECHGLNLYTMSFRIDYFRTQRSWKATFYVIQVFCKICFYNCYKRVQTLSFWTNIRNFNFLFWWPKKFCILIGIHFCTSTCQIIMLKSVYLTSRNLCSSLNGRNSNKF